MSTQCMSDNFSISKTTPFKLSKVLLTDSTCYTYQCAVAKVVSRIRGTAIITSEMVTAVRLFALMVVAPVAAAKLLNELAAHVCGQPHIEMGVIVARLRLGQVTGTTIADTAFQKTFAAVMDEVTAAIVATYAIDELEVARAIGHALNI